MFLPFKWRAGLNPKRPALTPSSGSLAISQVAQETGAAPSHVGARTVNNHVFFGINTESMNDSGHVLKGLLSWQGSSVQEANQSYPLKLQALGKLIFCRHIAHVTQKVVFFLRGKQLSEQLDMLLLTHTHKQIHPATQPLKHQSVRHPIPPTNSPSCS